MNIFLIILSAILMLFSVTGIAGAAAHAPEPLGMMLFGSVLIGIALFGRKKLLKK